MGLINERVNELVAQFGAPDACPAELLCDRHDPVATTFIVVHEGRCDRVRRPSPRALHRSGAHPQRVLHRSDRPGDVGAAPPDTIERHRFPSRAMWADDAAVTDVPIGSDR